MLTRDSRIISEPARARRVTITAILCVSGLLALTSAAIGIAAQSSPAATSRTDSIAIHNFMFNPMALTVAAGTTVSWTNFDGEPHTIKSVDDTFRSGALDQNDSFSFRFDKAGTYKYVCSIHPQMAATIVVK